jgi:hypothetical protein
MECRHWDDKAKQPEEGHAEFGTCLHSIPRFGEQYNELVAETSVLHPICWNLASFFAGFFEENA